MHIFGIRYVKQTRYMCPTRATKCNCEKLRERKGPCGGPRTSKLETEFKMVVSLRPWASQAIASCSIQHICLTRFFMTARIPLLWLSSLVSQFRLDATASNVLMLCKWCFSERHAFPPEKAKSVNCYYKKLQRYLQAHKIILLHAMDNAEFTIANNSSLHCPKFGRLFFFSLSWKRVTNPTWSILQEPVTNMPFHTVTKISAAFWLLRQCKYSEWETKPQGFTCARGPFPCLCFI